MTTLGTTAVTMDEDGTTTYWYGDEKVVAGAYDVTAYHASGNIARNHGVIIRESHDGTPHGIDIAVMRAIGRVPFDEETS